ncbi:hypothetical protein TRAPUB_9550 [Trametes pubescens]|uniref:Retrovirus-related Pol polyprotein from transposon TNT 1-94-like beta-barrel domain-containing protein n=1 Tax=Trametes pubescens TaxID=154538 RepID=A0A1M2W1Z1_TRAPU|nr:hypothetical protein TRAPUB_9550 [Trametes pubescens]
MNAKDIKDKTSNLNTKVTTVTISDKTIHLFVANTLHNCIHHLQWIVNSGIGNISLHLKQDRKLKKMIIPRVYYVPKLNGNLLSILHFLHWGYSVNFEQGGCALINAVGAQIATASISKIQNLLGIYWI